MSALATRDWGPPSERLRPRSVLTSDPGGVLKPGVYQADTSSGAFTCQLPLATGSQNSYVFVFRHTDVNPVTFVASGNDSFNVEGVHSVDAVSDSDMLTFLDASAGMYCFVQHSAAQGAGVQHVGVPVETITQVSGAGSTIYAGAPALGQVLVQSCSYFEQGHLRFVTLDLLAHEPGPFVLDLGQRALPAGAVLHRAWGCLVDYTGTEATSASPLVAISNTRNVRVDLGSELAGTVVLRISAVTGAESIPQAALTGVLEHNLRSASFFVFSQEQSMSDPFYENRWVRSWASEGSKLTTDGDVITGFDPEEHYTISCGVRLRDLAISITFLSSSGFNLLPSPRLPTSSSPYRGGFELYFDPTFNDDLQLRPQDGSRDGIITTDATYCLIQQLPKRAVAGCCRSGAQKHGDVTQAASEYTPLPGLHNLDSSQGPLDVRLPLATGSLQRFTLIALDVESNACQVRVPAGEALNGVVDGVYTVSSNRQVVMCVDAAPQQYWVMSPLASVAGSYAGRNTALNQYVPTAFPAFTLVAAEHQRSTGAFQSATTTATPLFGWSISVAVQEGDVVEVMGRAGGRVTQTNSTNLVLASLLHNGSTVGGVEGRHDTSTIGNFSIPVRALFGPLTTETTSTLQLQVALQNNLANVLMVSDTSLLKVKVYRSTAA